MNGTVKEFKETLEEMSGIYPFKDENTRICTVDLVTGNHNRLTVVTTDERTGIQIEMSKALKENAYE